MNEETAPAGAIFEGRVADLFRLLGFEVRQDLLIAGRQVDLFLEERSGLLRRTYLVECKDQSRPVTTQQYDTFRGRLKAAKGSISPKLRGIIVASVGFVKEAKAQSQYEDIDLLTITELETTLIDFQPYLRDLRRDLKDDPAAGWFIEPKLAREGASTPELAFAALDGWLIDPELNQLTLLGDYGTGKTTLLRQYAARLLARYEEQTIRGGARARLPILIDLRQYTQAISLKQIILDLLDTHGVRASSFATFDYLSTAGQLLIILDGFDEMASRGNYKVTLENFRELNRNARGRSKLILSCRTHYFASGAEVDRFVGRRAREHDLSMKYTDLYREIVGRGNFCIHYLPDFSSAEVTRYLQRRCGERAQKVAAFIAGTYNLDELSRRPVLLDMIVSSEQRLGERRHGETDERAVTPGVLYQFYVDIWLQQNDWSTLLDVKTKGTLLERFAREAEDRPDYRLGRRTIPRLIREWKGDVDQASVQEIDQELRTASFLVREGAESYRFSHRSFQDFFLARYLLEAAKRGEESAWGQGFFRTEVYRFLLDLVAESETAQGTLLGWLAEGRASKFGEANAVKCLSRTRTEPVREALVRCAREQRGRWVEQYVVSSLGYQQGRDVEATLMEAVVDGESAVVRSNALIALGRIGSDRAVQFSLDVLAGAVEGVRIDDLHRLWIYEAASGFPSERLVQAYIESAPLLSRRNSLPAACISLCKGNWSEAGERYCQEVIRQNPLSLRIVASAFSLLPVESRRGVEEIALQLAEVHFNTGAGGARRHVIRLIRGLSGLRTETAKKFLERIVDEVPGLGEVGFEVLGGDYPELVLGRAREWAAPAPRRSYRLRSAVARRYLELAGPNGLEVLRMALRGSAKPALQFEVLDLASRYFPEHLEELVLGMWEGRTAALVCQRGVELLSRVDRQAGHRFMLERGMRDARGGIRVAMCKALSSESGREVKEALLERLTEDSSKFVRFEALRSLLRPGSGASKEELVAATSSESDGDVIAMRREFLGV